MHGMTTLKSPSFQVPTVKNMEGHAVENDFGIRSLYYESILFEFQYEKFFIEYLDIVYQAQGQNVYLQI